MISFCTGVDIMARYQLRNNNNNNIYNVSAARKHSNITNKLSESKQLNN